MSPVWVPDPDLEPDLSHLVTEDDEPVDNRFSERQQRLLPHLLFSSWPQGKPFEALSDVGLFYALDEPAVAPDFMLSVGVKPRPLTSDTKDRSYLIWVYGKPPDLCIEVVSNLKGRELGEKMELYARIRVTYYVVYDPFLLLGDRKVRAFCLNGGRYTEILVTDPFYLDELGLGLTLWDGVIEDTEGCWLRFVDKEGRMLLTGEEALVQERARVERERARADESELKAAESIREVARKLLAQGLDRSAVLSATGLPEAELDHL